MGSAGLQQPEEGEGGVFAAGRSKVELSSGWTRPQSGHTDGVKEIRGRRQADGGVSLGAEKGPPVTLPWGLLDSNTAPQCHPHVTCQESLQTRRIT